MRILSALDPVAVAQAEAELRGGNIIALPTDTVYGLACLASMPDACERLFRLKERSAEQPMAVLFASLRDLRASLPSLSTNAVAACNELLPGAFTLVVSNNDGLCPWLCGTTPTAIGLRVPVGALNLPPLAATSANEAGKPEVRRLDHLPDSIADSVSCGLHATELPDGASASTVLDLTDWETGGDVRVVRDDAGRFDDARERLAAVALVR